MTYYIYHNLAKVRICLRQFNGKVQLYLFIYLFVIHISDSFPHLKNHFFPHFLFSNLSLATQFWYSISKFFGHLIFLPSQIKSHTNKRIQTPRTDGKTLSAPDATIASPRVIHQSRGPALSVPEAAWLRSALGFSRGLSLW